MRRTLSRDPVRVNRGAMAILLVVNTPPYGSEGPYDAFRLAEALALREERIHLSLMGGGVHAACAGQQPRDAYGSLGAILFGLLERGVTVVCCGTCCHTRGIVRDDLLEGVTLATMHDLAEEFVGCERTLSF